MNRPTPGPWKIGEASWSDAGFARYELVGVTLLTAADAKLISAAPDLLEALELAAGYISHEQIEHAWINAPDKPAIELGAFLRAAIAKATS